MQYQIFISYRRDGGEFLGRMIYDRLIELGYKVFFDVESLRSGKFNEQLYEVIEKCDDFILLLSPNSLERCLEPEDWILKEVSYAITNKKNIIPVMMKKFVFPESIPLKISQIKDYEALSFSMEYWDAFIEKLHMHFLHSKAMNKEYIRYELEQKEYYNIKVPFINYYKSRKQNFWDISCSGKLKIRVEIEENCYNLCHQFSNVDNYMYYEKNLNQYLEYVGVDKKRLEQLLVKIMKLKEYTSHNGDKDSFFYSEYVLYLLGMRQILNITIQEKNREISKRFPMLGSPFEEILGVVVLCQYLLDIDDIIFWRIDKIYEEKHVYNNDFRKYVPQAFDVWNKFLDKSKKDYSVEYKNKYSYFGVLLFDLIIDTAELVSEIAKYSPNLRAYVRHMILCYYKYLKKKGILLPKEIQKKVYDF
ncbi:MAG: toll/interleukin-1 receptor domain-containing protein [Eubacterium sp.]